MKVFKEKTEVTLGLKFYKLCFLIAASLLVIYLLNKSSLVASNSNTALVSGFKSLPNKYKSSRLSGYNYIKPLLYVDEINEASEFSNLKFDIEKLLNEKKSSGDINSASVYLKVFGKGWLSVNPKEHYQLQNLFTVPLLMCYLKASESDPAILNRELKYKANQSEKSHPISLNLPKIESGKSYSIKELIYYLTTCGDNNAFQLLLENTDINILNKIYEELGLETIKGDYSGLVLTAADFSIFYKVLYNATYLSKANSEYALKLLSNTPEYKSLTSNTINRSTTKPTLLSSKDYEYEIHNSGIIFVDSIPCLLTVMTKGWDVIPLQETIRQISKLTQRRLNQP